MLGLSILVGLVWQLDHVLLIQTLVSADPLWFLTALLLAIAANLVSAMRWQRLSGYLGYSQTLGSFIDWYARGIAANSVLPGGIVGGDVLRATLLHRRQPSPGKARAAQSVLIDRASGFWALALIGLMGSAAFIGLVPAQHQPAWLGAYAAGLVAALVGPWLLPTLKWGAIQTLINLRGLLLRVAPLSVLMQLLTIAAYGLCLKSAGIEPNLALLLAVCAGIFLLAVVPASLGGFGAREAASLAMLLPFGLTAEPIMVGSILFGLTATLQGILGLWFWFRRHDEKPKS